MLFAVMHTSASLTINENASSDVPLDLNVSFTTSAWGAIRFLVFLQRSPVWLPCTSVIEPMHNPGMVIIGLA